MELIWIVFIITECASLHGTFLERFGTCTIKYNTCMCTAIHSLKTTAMHMYSLTTLLFQEEYLSTHQFFITPGSAYAVCCQAKCLFESGVSLLLPWLVMIEVRINI